MSDAAASAGSNLWLQGHGPVVAAALHEWQLRPETASSSSVHSFCSVSMVDAMELDTATKAPTHSRELLHAWGEAWREAGTAGSSQRLQQPQAASDSHHLPCNSSNGCEQAKAKAKARETSREPGNAEGSALQPRSPRFQEPEERLADRPAEATLPRPRAARASRKKPKSSDGLSGAASSFSAALQRREPGETSKLAFLWQAPSAVSMEDDFATKAARLVQEQATFVQRVEEELSELGHSLLRERCLREALQQQVEWQDQVRRQEAKQLSEDLEQLRTDLAQAMEAALWSGREVTVVRQDLARARLNGGEEPSFLLGSAKVEEISSKAWAERLQVVEENVQSCSKSLAENGDFFAKAVADMSRRISRLSHDCGVLEESMRQLQAGSASSKPAVPGSELALQADPLDSWICDRAQPPAHGDTPANGPSAAKQEETPAVRTACVEQGEPLPFSQEPGGRLGRKEHTGRAFLRPPPLQAAVACRDSNERPAHRRLHSAIRVSPT
ncbi:unnamed protein product [Symbiodinium pilosum]|uniref:Uncharacterized protein n=1 Tax=Symbiodinium pilosum TaxID=2952 RepID=A0A812TKD1_SYMPI|nr:unnamed protein product [Symbiodinium pilosum]